MLRKRINRIIGKVGKQMRFVCPMLIRRLQFLRLFKRPMNLKNPVTFSEKIIQRMSSEAYEQLWIYADKFQVREYVKNIIGKEHLVPLLAVYEKPEDICYEQIPESSYIKLNHGSGYNVVWHKEQQAQIHRQVCRWFKEDYAHITTERQYRLIPRRILVEKNLMEDTDTLCEYNFFVFNGKVEFVQIRDNHGHRFEVGRDYQDLPFRMYSTVTPKSPEDERFPELVEYAEKLAAPFSFVRVDFFQAGPAVYFSELTFSPGGGMKMFEPSEYNVVFGEKLG